MNKVELLFKDRGISRAGTYVYTKQTAIDFVNECRKLNIGILGIDALIIRGDFTEPSIANSIDFTATPYLQNFPKNIWDASIIFLEQRDDIYYFEIVCSDE